MGVLARNVQPQRNEIITNERQETLPVHRDVDTGRSSEGDLQKLNEPTEARYTSGRYRRTYDLFDCALVSMCAHLLAPRASRARHAALLRLRPRDYRRWTSPSRSRVRLALAKQKNKG